MLVGLHVPTDFQMYRQNSEKALLGGGGAIAPLPPPPSGYANVAYTNPLYRVPPPQKKKKTEQSIQSIFQDFALINRIPPPSPVDKSWLDYGHWHS